jgi:hypothetical protein
MQNPIHRKRLAGSLRAPLLAAILVCWVVIAGCGASSRSPSGATAGDAGSSASTGAGAYGSGPQAFSTCMRANGVPQFPDLSNDGMRIGARGQTVSVNGVSLNAPAFSAALQKCERYRQHTSASPAQTTEQTRKGLEFARCMRSHGVPNFPDPKAMPGVDGNSVASLPGVNIQSPAFQSAAKACGGGPKGP